MELNRPLSLITPTVDADVLQVLAGADAAFTGSQVHRLAGLHSERGVRNSLHRLVAQGMVTADRAGASVMYRLNRAHLAAPYVIALADLRNELLRRISDLVNGWPVAADFVALFGSAARGRMELASDIDLFVVRPVGVEHDDAAWHEQVDQLADQVTAWTGNDARILLLSAEEVREGLGHAERVLADVREQGIRLHGSPRYLRPIAEARG